MDNNQTITQYDIPPGTIKQRHLTASLEVAEGDLYYGDGNNNFIKLPIGTANQILKVSSNTPTWSTNTGSTLVSCLVSTNSIQSVTGTTPTVISFDTDISDTSGLHNPVTNNSRITVSATGLYLVGFKVIVDQDGNLSTANASLLLNGATSYVGSYISWIAINAGEVSILEHSQLVSLTSGDYLEIQITIDVDEDILLNGAGGSYNPVFWLSQVA